jgi:hypothetical protein
MRKFKFILDRRTIEKIYLTFIRPLLEYGDVVWDCKTVYLTNKLESVQAEAARVVTGGTRQVSLSKLYAETRWEYLKDRREKHRLTYFYKMNNGLTPGYLSSLVRNTLRNIHDHNTRHSTLISPVRARTTLYAHYFLPQTVRSWNLLPDSTHNCPSINVFKSRLNLNIIYDKPTFVYVGSRLGHIFHARIRMGCSALNSDLFRKNIVNSPHCTCGAIETPTHYLLNCPHYNIPRQTPHFHLTFLFPCPLNFYW